MSTDPPTALVAPERLRTDPLEVLAGGCSLFTPRTRTGGGPSLTVEENLTAVARPGAWSLAQVYGLFPRLREHRGNMVGQLSPGGEQQMLAVGRVLVTNPALLLLDEPLEGLAPVTVEALLAILRRVMREGDTGAVIVEQNAPRIVGITDQAVILERGTIVCTGPSAQLGTSAATLNRFLGTAHGLGSAA